MKELQDKGWKEIPARLRQPVVYAGFGSLLDDFFELSTDRQLGAHATGPIPAASIDRRTAGMRPGWAAIYRTLMRSMDGAFIRWANRRE